MRRASTLCTRLSDELRKVEIADSRFDVLRGQKLAAVKFFGAAGDKVAVNGSIIDDVADRQARPLPCAARSGSHEAIHRLAIKKKRHPKKMRRVLWSDAALCIFLHIQRSSL
jgi:hypothetical protein